MSKGVQGETLLLLKPGIQKGHLRNGLFSLHIHKERIVSLVIREKAIKIGSGKVC